MRCATSIRVARDYFEGRNNGGSEEPEFGMTGGGKRKEEGGAGCGNGMRKCDVGNEAGNRYATKQRRFHKRCPRAIGENSIHSGNVANSRSVLWAPVRSTRTTGQISGRANISDP